jgi:hypothetical protein
MRVEICGNDEEEEIDETEWAEQEDPEAEGWQNNLEDTQFLKNALHLRMKPSLVAKRKL